VPDLPVSNSSAAGLAFSQPDGSIAILYTYLHACQPIFSLTRLFRYHLVHYQSTAWHLPYYPRVMCKGFNRGHTRQKLARVAGSPPAPSLCLGMFAVLFAGVLCVCSTSRPVPGMHALGSASRPDSWQSQQGQALPRWHTGGGTLCCSELRVGGPCNNFIHCFAHQGVILNSSNIFTALSTLLRSVQSSSHAYIYRGSFTQSILHKQSHKV
jgi:hypothetical protein